MGNVRDALMRMVEAWNNGAKMLEAYHAVGLNDNLIHQMCDEIADAIYKIVGEHTEEWTDSTTFIALNAQILSDERKVEMLMSEYRKNNSIPEHEENIQPAPFITTTDEINRMFEQSGGYRYETPEGDWTLGDYQLHEAQVALRECGKELCNKCGKHIKEHKGFCNGCRWRYVKNGEIPT